jgi:hypothetical protein
MLFSRADELHGKAAALLDEVLDNVLSRDVYVQLHISDPSIVEKQGMGGCD